jgi:hypothetical protein
VKNHTAPIEPLSPGPPTIAVLPSVDSDTDQPSCEYPVASLAVSFCCWVHVPPLRVKTHAAPVPLLSNGAPTMAVLPSVEIATEKPCSTLPMGSLTVSFGTLLCAVAGCVRHSSAAHISAAWRSRDVPRATQCASATAGEQGESMRSVIWY